MTDWNPNMDDAPRDGTELLVWADGFSGAYFAVAREDGWWVADGFPSEWTELCKEPTHWMHLPAPPEGEE